MCRSFGIEGDLPSNGSNYVVWHPEIDGQLTIPAKRPIKPIYIQLLVSLVEGALKLE